MSPSKFPWEGPAGTCLSGVGCGAAGFRFAEALAASAMVAATCLARLAGVIKFLAIFAWKPSNPYGIMMNYVCLSENREPPNLMVDNHLHIRTARSRQTIFRQTHVDLDES